MTTSLCFNDFTFSPVAHQNSLWIRAAELARALGYKRSDILNKLYTQNADEFTPDMTQVLEIVDNTESVFPTKARIFSLRGCHLIAMFARTPVAKQFRRWVLDVLDQLAAQERALTSNGVSADTLPPASVTLSPSTTADRAPLRSMVNAWSKVSGQQHDALWPQVRSAFNLSRIDQLPAEWIPDAIAWVQDKIDGVQRAIPAAPATPVASYAPPARPVLSTELQRYAEDFERLCGPVAEMERVLTQVMRLSYPLVRETTLSMCEGRLAAAEQQVARGHLESALEEHLEHSRRMVHDIITCGRLGINVVRDLARVQGR